MCLLNADRVSVKIKWHRKRMYIVHDSDSLVQNGAAMIIPSQWWLIIINVWHPITYIMED